MTNLADLHCHLLPYVDDGAAILDTSMELLRMQVEQGVHTICLTPHLRKGMFETPDEEILRQFRRLQSQAEAEGLPVTLYLSREYHCDELFWQHMEQGTLLPLGKSRTVLLEFSHRHDFDEIKYAAWKVLKAGWVPLIAHVERYPAVRGEISQAAQLVALGAKLQCNASSVLGREGFWQKRFCHALLKAKLISVVASDAHDTEVRLPELGTCAEYLSRRFGQNYADSLTSQMPLSILEGTD